MLKKAVNKKYSNYTPHYQPSSAQCYIYQITTYIFSSYIPTILTSYKAYQATPYLLSINYINFVQSSSVLY